MPAKENSRRKHAPAEPTAAEIFDKPPAPAQPLPAAWTDNSIARELADEHGAEMISGELIAMNGKPPKKKAPAAPKLSKEERTQLVIDDTLSKITQARIIQIKEYPELRWAVKGIIPEGCTLIAGPLKLGKSIFSLNIAVAVAEGGKALSYFDVEQGAVLYLALEDSERRIQKRLKKLAPDELSGNLEVVTKWPRLNMGGLDAIEAWARTRENARLLIVDTFKMLRPLRTGQNPHQSTYDIDYEDVEPLTAFTTQNRICLMIVTHTRKAMADDPLATVSGSFGLTGAADGVLVLSRQRNNRSATLSVVGRDVEEAELALEFKPDLFIWEVIGESKSVKQRDEKKEILEILKESNEPMQPVEIAALIGKPNNNTFRSRILRMKQGGEIKLFGKGYQLPGYASDKKHVSSSSNSQAVASIAMQRNATVPCNGPNSMETIELNAERCTVACFDMESKSDNRSDHAQSCNGATDSDYLPYSEELGPLHGSVADRCMEEHATGTHKPHVSNNSGNNEWYTPPEYIEAARTVLETIDLDPASSEVANQFVKAEKFYTIEDDGLSKEWNGRVWMNPPYAARLVEKFTKKLYQHLKLNHVSEAIILVNNATETRWYQSIYPFASAYCIPKKRIKYLDATGAPANSPLQGQVFLYFGSKPEIFIDVFSEFGRTDLIR